MKKIILFVMAAGVLILVPSCQKEESLSKDSGSMDLQTVPNRYVVVFQSTTFKSLAPASYPESVEVVRQEARKVVSEYDIPAEAVDLAYAAALKGFAVEMSPEQAELLAQNPKIKYVVPDKVYQLGPITAKKRPPKPSPSQDSPYGIVRVGHGDGSGKTAWIIDTGIDLDHPDLNVDASRGANFTRAKSPDDDNGHGSHVAGTIAALDNNIGVVGVAAGATVVPVKVLDRRGSGYYSWIIAGVDYVAANASPGDAANMSLGGSAYQPIDDAVAAAAAKGIYFALAAGNESDDANNHSPARVNGNNIFTVSAMDDQDVFAYFSNYGNPPVDFCEPGVSILSTYKKGGYATMSGTSMAAPHMCGILLMTQGRPNTDGYVNGDPDGHPDPIGHI